jgi:2-polyprenyl-3-methyl-5-hydroxy-6-metoxy-1,4-benzoquinol methylase
MKQVSYKYYDKKYFNYQSSSPDFTQKLESFSFHKKYQEISNLVKLKSSDLVCDYGCGNGDLSFLLFLKYKCHIKAIDYSPTAIKICQNKLKLFSKNTKPCTKIEFINKNNNSITKYKNVKVVFFCDVIEHLYPQEINMVIKNISSWGNPLIIIHTDNNNYLKFIQPFINLLSLISGSASIKEIVRNYHLNRQRHVNLTTPKKLKKTLLKLGYSQNKLVYPTVDIPTITQQLGGLSRFSFFIKISSFFVNTFPFLSPSFYSVYSKTHKVF